MSKFKVGDRVWCKFRNTYLITDYHVPCEVVDGDVQLDDPGGSMIVNPIGSITGATAGGFIVDNTHFERIPQPSNDEDVEEEWV